MSIENSRLPQTPDFPPKGPTDNEVITENGGSGVPDTAYELLGGVPGDVKASAANFQYPSSVGPASAWTPEQNDAFKKIIDTDPSFQIDPTDTSFPERVVEMAAGLANGSAPIEKRAAVETTPISNENKEKKFSTKQKIAASLIAVLTAAGIGAGLKAATDSKNPAPDTTPASNSAPITPGQQESSPEPTETTSVKQAALELKKDMTTEEAAMTVVGILSEWGMAGANEDLYKEMMTTDHMTKYGQTRAERERFAGDVAARTDDIYIKKLLGANYDQNNPVNIKLIHDLKQDHVTNLYNFIVSAPAYYSNVKPGDPPVGLSGYQPWNQELKYLKIQSTTDNNGFTTIAIDANDTDNRDKNDIGSMYPGVADHNLLVTVTFQDSDKSHITSATVAAH